MVPMICVDPTGAEKYGFLCMYTPYQQMPCIGDSVEFFQPTGWKKGTILNVHPNNTVDIKAMTCFINKFAGPVLVRKRSKPPSFSIPAIPIPKSWSSAIACDPPTIANSTTEGLSADEQAVPIQATAVPTQATSAQAVGPGDLAVTPTQATSVQDVTPPPPPPNPTLAVPTQGHKKNMSVCLKFSACACCPSKDIAPESAVPLQAQPTPESAVPLQAQPIPESAVPLQAQPTDANSTTEGLNADGQEKAAAEDDIWSKSGYSSLPWALVLKQVGPKYIYIYICLVFIYIYICIRLYTYVERERERPRERERERERERNRERERDSHSHAPQAVELLRTPYVH